MRWRTSLLLLFLCATTGWAQLFYFGRNKVQYTDFAWHVLKTPHFDIYYYPEMKDLAERGAAFAEEAFRHLEVKFNHTLVSRVPLIFYSSHLHFQQTNTTGGFLPEGIGGFFEFLKGRVVIPADGSMPQFRHVIRHELVHVFMHSKISRVLTDHRKPQDRYPPLWFIEGLAEYWSTDWDSQAEMVMRDAVLNDIVVGLDDIDRIYGSFLMYKEGQAALSYMGRIYGEEKVLLLMENFWKEASFSEVLKLTIGKNYREFDEGWLYALKKESYPLLKNFDSPAQVTRKITKEGFNSKPVVLERDSMRTVYFIGNRTGYTSIYAKSLDAAENDPSDTLIVEGESSDEFEAFHPFRSRIDISKNGILAFVTKSGENDALHLFNTGTGTITRTFRFPDIVSIGSSSWAPDGVRLVFSGINKSGNNDLYLLHTEAGTLHRLTNDYYDDRDPAWSPRGDKIAFSSDRTSFGSSGAYNLFLYDLTTGAIEYLTCGPESSGSPAWSRDGSMLAFTSDVDGVHNIWVMKMTPADTPPPIGGPPRPAPRWRFMTRVTSFVSSAYDPTWTSSGDLVFAAFERYGFQLRHIQNVRALVDSATDVRSIDLFDKQKPWELATVSGSSQMERYRYRGEYSLDFAQSAISTDPVFGTTGGAVVALSDVLGDDQYYFLIYNTAQSQDELLSSFNVAISRLSLRQRANYAYGIYRFNGRRYDLTDRDQFFYERVFGGYFALSYPLTQFQRIETSTSLSNSNKELDVAIESRRALLLSNALAFTHDNSLWGPTGPLDGSRLRVQLAYTTDIQYSNVSYYTLIADYRKYLRLGTRAAYASRFWLFYNSGKESRRFVMGGSWDLRGYGLWSIRGEKLWLTSHELRFPFIDQLAIRLPFMGIAFSSIRGAAFLDAGGAWDSEYRETLGSMGLGLRMNLGGVLVLRYDIGKRIERNFTRLQTGLFYQFFFGWDF
jgi:WD40 repeat protein